MKYLMHIFLTENVANSDITFDKSILKKFEKFICKTLFKTGYITFFEVTLDVFDYLLLLKQSLTMYIT